MTIESNKNIVRRYLEEGSKACLKDINEMDNYADPRLTVISPPKPAIHGLENVKKATAPLFGALSDVKVTIHELVGENDRVAGSWTFQMTIKANLSFPERLMFPAGKTLSWRSVGLFRVHEGKIIEERTHIDVPRLMQQLGFRSILVFGWIMFNKKNSNKK